MRFSSLILSIAALLFGGCGASSFWQSPALTEVPLQVDAEHRVLVLPPDVHIQAGGEAISADIAQGILGAGGASFIPGDPMLSLIEGPNGNPWLPRLLDGLERSLFDGGDSPDLTEVSQATQLIAEALDFVGETPPTYLLLSRIRPPGGAVSGSQRWEVFGAVLAAGEPVSVLTAFRRTITISVDDIVAESRGVGELLATRPFCLGRCRGPVATVADEPAPSTEALPASEAPPSAERHLSPEAIDLRRGCDSGDRAACERVCHLFRQGRAATEYGRRFQRGGHLPRDLSKAARLYRFGCERGYARGCNHLGHLYQHGLGVEADPTTAIELASVVLDDHALRCKVGLFEFSETSRRILPLQPRWERRPEQVAARAARAEDREVLWRPNLYTLFGAGRLFGQGEDERNAFIFDVLLAAQIGLVELADNGRVIFGIAPEVGYSFRRGDRFETHAGVIGIAAGFLFGFNVDVSLSAAGVFGTVGGEPTVGIRSGLRISALASIIHVRFMHEWQRAGDLDVHAFRFTAGIDVGFLVIFLLALSAI